MSDRDFFTSDDTLLTVGSYFTKPNFDDETVWVKLPFWATVTQRHAQTDRVYALPVRLAQELGASLVRQAGLVQTGAPPDEPKH